MIQFSNFGLISLNNAALKQSIEIVRRRIDDVGTKEPTILQRGDKRILVELPGIKDPERIKNLIGKTAKITLKKGSSLYIPVKIINPKKLVPSINFIILLASIILQCYFISKLAILNYLYII